MNERVRSHLLNRGIADLARVALACQRIIRHFRHRVGEIVWFNFGDILLVGSVQKIEDRIYSDLTIYKCKNLCFSFRVSSVAQFLSVTLSVTWSLSSLLK